MTNFAWRPVVCATVGVSGVAGVLVAVVVAAAALGPRFGARLLKNFFMMVGRKTCDIVS